MTTAVATTIPPMIAHSALEKGAKMRKTSSSVSARSWLGTRRASTRSPDDLSTTGRSTLAPRAALCSNAPHARSAPPAATSSIAAAKLVPLRGGRCEYVKPARRATVASSVSYTPTNEPLRTTVSGYHGTETTSKCAPTSDTLSWPP